MPITHYADVEAQCQAQLARALAAALNAATPFCCAYGRVGWTTLTARKQLCSGFHPLAPISASAVVFSNTARKALRAATSPSPASYCRSAFFENSSYGRHPNEPLFPELLPQGAEKTRSIAFGDRFVHHRKGVKVYDKNYDFRSFRGIFDTCLRNLPDVNAG